VVVGVVVVGEIEGGGDGWGEGGIELEVAQ